jgi:acetate kinase
MLVLRALSDWAAQEAIALFVYRFVRELGSLVATLGGLDGAVFSAGIDEHDAATRAEVVAPAGREPVSNPRGMRVAKVDQR